MQELYPGRAARDISEVYAEPPTVAAGVHVSMNVITTVDGRAAVAGGSHRIGSPTDHRLMRQLRSHADAVVTGAGTLLAEGIAPGIPTELEARRIERGQRPQPLSVLLGGRQGVNLRGRLRELRPDALVVFLPSGAEAPGLHEKATVHFCTGERPAPGEVVRTLQERYGVRRILLEGGPRIYSAFLSTGLVHDLYWTLAPKLTAAEAPRMLESTPLEVTALQLRSIHEHEGELYVHYAVGGTWGSGLRAGVDV